MKRTYLFLLVNIGLWLYTINGLIKALTTPVNSLDTKVKSAFTGTNNFLTSEWKEVSHFIFDWETIIFILLAIVLVVLMVVFWRITFIALVVLTFLVVVWLTYYAVNGRILLENYYPVVVLIITAGNIYLAAKVSKLL
ncbi:hypothetical protein ACFO26_06255 [Lactococcus nasutitermitis]|uniref:Uncharacterized protein n=1 Tax=Lactococcus nasutitermitis TaxID=1652957 RepID=A0ABV9JDK0_9LACT|nr:hypothetical protein [Lactococcus nasutitermitis]